jgi:hypothetical protein
MPTEGPGDPAAADGVQRKRTSVPLAAPAPPPDALEPGFHGVRTHWIRGFMTFQLARRTWSVMPMVPV